MLFAYGSKIVINTLSLIDLVTQVETGIFRYELGEDNMISRTEVEDYNVRHYAPIEIEKLLGRHNLVYRG